MSDSITVTGTVATPPRHVETEDHLEVTTFRLASAQRRYDRKQQKWVDGGTNWYTVVAFRQLASNAARSINKGDRVIAFGRPRVRDWTSEERSGTNMEIEVESLGHDLLWGRTEYIKTVSSRSVESESGTPGDGESPAASESAPSESAVAIDERELETAPAF